MTVICVKPKRDTWGKLIVLECDTCHKLFERAFQALQLEREHHFDTRTCANVAKKSGGVLNVKFERTCVERFGVVNPFQSEECKAKSLATLRGHFGEWVTNPSQVPEVRDKITASYVERFGVEHPLKVPEIREARTKLACEREGVSSLFEIAVKRGTAFMAFNDPNVRAKALEARIANGTVFVSKLEAAFFERLVGWGYDVKTQVRVGKWPIDGLVNGVHVQHDGDHHHGIQERSRSYPKVIKQMERDAAQNGWFVSHGLKLLRVSSSVASVVTFEQFDRALRAVEPGKPLVWFR